MTPPVFIAPAAALRAASVGDVVRLDGNEGRHAATVRRLRVGERLDLVDGAGLRCAAEVVAVSTGALEARVLDRSQAATPAPRLVVVQALVKGERAEQAVEAMTEVGVDVIVPWQAARSVVRWDAGRAGKALDRWRSTAREAAKQARRAWLPDVAELASTESVAALLAAAAADGLALVLHESGGQPLASIAVPTSGDVVAVVGPEGGVTDDELATFEAAGATVCRLGSTVLRASTAGTAAAAVLLANGGRW